MKILLAEDNDALRRAAVRDLARLGHEVVAHEDGARLCDAIRAGATADAIWTDLAMPEGDGFEVIRVARKHLGDVPVLVVSGHADGDNVLRALLREGADYFLPKPYDPSDLSAVLRRIEATLGAFRDKVRMWHSFTRCDVELRVPPDAGVAAATAALLAKHCRSFLDDAACRGVQIAATEILMNALEHGCLEISRDEKSEALKKGAFDALFAARRADARLGGRTATVRMIAAPDRGVEITISDPGPGFDPEALPDASDPDAIFNPSGRGITVARWHVDELSYDDGGRRAILRAGARRSAP
jgi:CheY-like chemotaxis protein